MIKVNYRVGGKSENLELLPVSFDITFSNSNDLEYIPRFVFRKEYLLPHEIVFYRIKKDKKNHECTTIPCAFKTKKLSLKFDSYISRSNLKKKNKYYSTYNLLNNYICGDAGCEHCKAFLPLNLSGEIYFNFVLLFQEVAKDLYNAWEDAVRKAKESVEFEKDQVIITTENYKDIPIVRESVLIESS